MAIGTKTQKLNARFRKSGINIKVSRKGARIQYDNDNDIEGEKDEEITVRVLIEKISSASTPKSVSREAVVYFNGAEAYVPVQGDVMTIRGDRFIIKTTDLYSHEGVSYHKVEANT